MTVRPHGRHRRPLRRSARGRRRCVLRRAAAARHDARQPADVVATVQRADRDGRDRPLDDAVPTTGYVEFGPTQALGMRTPVETAAGLDHTATLLGLTADAPALLSRRVGRGRRRARRRQRRREHPHRRPAGRPAGPDADRRAATTGSWSSRCSARRPPSPSSIRRGESSGTTPTIGSSTSTARASPSTARACSTTPRRSPASRRRRPSWCACRSTGRSRRSIPIPLLAHDFVEHADGTLAAIAFEDRQDVDGTPHPRQQAGRGRARRNAAHRLDQLELLRSDRHAQGDDPQQGWTFANALDYDAADGRLLRRHAQFQQHRQGQPRDRRVRMGAGPLRQRRSRSRPAPPRFLHEHQFDVHGNRILIMDNDGAPGDESRVLEYELDVTTKHGDAGLELHREPQRLHVRSRRAGSPRGRRHVRQLVDGGTDGAARRDGRVGLEAEHGRRLRVRFPNPDRPAFTAASRHECKGDRT